MCCMKYFTKSFLYYQQENKSLMNINLPVRMFPASLNSVNPYRVKQNCSTQQFFLFIYLFLLVSFEENKATSYIFSRKKTMKNIQDCRLLQS